MTPEEVPDLRATLARSWGPGGRYDDTRDRWHQRTLAGADCWFADRSMCAALDRLAPGVPDFLLLDYSGHRGLVAFERPVAGIAAVHYGPSLIPDRSPRTDRIDLLPTCTIVPYDDQLDPLPRCDWPACEPLGITRTGADLAVRRLMAAWWIGVAQLCELELLPVPWLAGHRVRRFGYDDRPIRIPRITVHATATTERGGSCPDDFVASLRWRNQPVGPGGRNRKLTVVWPQWRPAGT